MTRFFFRFDAAPEIGLGHARRCGVLAAALIAEGAEILAVVRSRDLTNEQLGFPESAQFEFLPWEIDPDEDAQRLSTIARYYEARAGVVDHYRQPASYQQTLAKAGLRWMQFCNSGLHTPLGGDLLFDASPGADPQEYGADRIWRQPAEILSGPAFALVAPEFATARQLAASPWAERSEILITFGGGDDQGAIILALDALDAAAAPGTRTVLTTSLNPRLEVIRARCHRSANVKLVVDDWSPAPLMANCHAAICGGGTTLYELATLGVPALIISIAANQVAPAQRWMQAGFGTYLGDIADPDPATLAAILSPLLAADGPLRQWSETAAHSLDGQGAHRTALALLRLAAF